MRELVTWIQCPKLRKSAVCDLVDRMGYPWRVVVVVSTWEEVKVPRRPKPVIVSGS